MKLFKVLIFFLIVPGSAYIYIPLLLGIYGPLNQNPLAALRSAAWVAWLVGPTLALLSIAYLVKLGRGTPAPFEPTREIVDRGVYRLTRNPMYLGGFIILLGYVFWFQTLVQVIYFLAALPIYQLIVIRYEEPHLHRQYGTVYKAYCTRTPRWLI